MRFFTFVAVAYLALCAFLPPQFLLYLTTSAMGLLVLYQAFYQSALRPDLGRSALTGLLPVLAFIVSYAGIEASYTGDIRLLFAHTVLLAVCYLLGFFCAGLGVQNAERAGIWMLTTLAVAGAVYAVLCVYITGVETYGINERGVSIFTDIWGGMQVSTNLTLRATVAIALVTAIAAVSSAMSLPLQWLLRGGLLVSAVGSLYATLQIGNRTGIVVILMSNLTIAVVMAMHLIRRGRRRSGVSVLALALLAAAIFYAVSQIDVAGSRLFMRLERLEWDTGGRLEATATAFLGLLDNPMGGKVTDLAGGFGYAHNLWADVAYSTGIIPLALLVFINIQHLVPSVRLLLHPGIDLLWKSLVAGLLVTLFLYFAVEPAIEANIFNLATYCLLCGLVKRLDAEGRYQALLEQQPSAVRFERPGWPRGGLPSRLGRRPPPLGSHG